MQPVSDNAIQYSTQKYSKIGNAQVNIDPLEVVEIPCISPYSMKALKDKINILNRILNK
jgi:hypothetical protein